MATEQLAASTVHKISQYIDEGIPLKDLDVSNVTRERVRVAERCYERLQQDPWMDRRHYLMRIEGRTRNQVVFDLQVVDLFMTKLNNVSRQLVEHRREVTLNRLARGAEETGDLKMQERVLTHIEKQLADMGEEREDVIKNTAALPAVLVGVSVVDPSKQELNDNQFIALLKKYDGKQDQIDEMIHERREAILLEGQSTKDDVQTAGYMQEITPQMQMRQEQEALYKARIAELEEQLRKAQGKETKQDVLDMLNEMMDNGEL